MAYLTEKEKCILFSAIHREENVCKEHGFDDLVQVCKRLTHLFSYNKFEKDIRNKVIDEFVNRIECESANDWLYDLEDDEEYNNFLHEIEEIAKQMKGE